MAGAIKFSAILSILLFLFSNILFACTSADNFCDGDIFNFCDSGNWAAINCAANGDTCIGSGLSAGCTQSVPAGCIDGTFQCSPTDANTRQFCQNGQWLDYESCIYGCSYATNTCNSCIDGTFQCSLTDANTRQFCQNGQWLDYESCIYGCDAVTGACTSPDCTPFDNWCDGNIFNFCDNGNWAAINCADNGQTCDGSGTSAECTNLVRITCTSANNFCDGNILTYCSNGKWETRSCNAEGKVCTGSGASASCTTAPPGGSGKVVGDSGIAPEDYSTGGGEVKKCTSWSEWYVNTSSTKLEKDGSNSRECVDETLRRYCYLSTGVLDFSHYETQNNLKCGEWSGTDKCDYVFESSQSYTDTSGEKCRTCERSTYAYACQPSGKTDYSNTKQSTACSSWRQCTPEEAAGTTVKPSRSDMDTLLEDYGLVIGAVIVVLLLVVLFATYKMFSTPEDEA